VPWFINLACHCVRPAKPNIMMNFRRIIQLTSSLAAALTLTACGGGDTGPQWVQDLKSTIVYGELQLPEGAVYSPCSAVTINRPLSFVTINVVEKVDGAYRLTVKKEFYGDPGCSDEQKLFTLTYPKSTLTSFGLGEDATSGLRYERFRSVSEGGNVQIESVEGAPVTFTPVLNNPSKVRIDITEGDILNYEEVVVIPAGTTGAELFGRDERSLYEESYAGALENVDGLLFPTQLKTDYPFRPYRFFNITPGTYANGTATTDGSTPDCDAITLPATPTAKTYGYIVKVVAEPIDQDYRPQISIEADYYADLNCNDRLVTIKTPPILLETVGNGIDPITGLTYRQVLQLQQAGEITATPTDSRVTVVGNVVTIVDGGATFQVGSTEASTSFDSMYFSEQTLYEGDKDSIDSAVSPFPTALLLEYPYILVD